MINDYEPLCAMRLTYLYLMAMRTAGCQRFLNINIYLRLLYHVYITIIF